MTFSISQECTFEGKCYKCGKAGHKGSVCKNKTTAMTRRVLITDCDSRQFTDSKYFVHIDNQSNENVFKTAELLDNIRDAEPVVIQGINGGDITCDKVGDFLGQVVYYNDMAVANILSWYKLSKELMVDWDAEQNVFTASTPDGDTSTFSCVDGGPYACDMADYTHA